MKKGTIDLLITSALLNKSEYGGYFINDEKVMECLMDMYFYMLYNGVGNDQKTEEYFNEFEKKYRNLNKEQQEEIKKEYLDIIEAQNKNREKEKVKKKGMNKYE